MKKKLLVWVLVALTALVLCYLAVRLALHDERKAQLEKFRNMPKPKFTLNGKEI